MTDLHKRLIISLSGLLRGFTKNCVKSQIFQAKFSTYVIGYYADGFFDRRVILQTPGSSGSALSAVSTGNNVACRGVLYYNPTNASLFLPNAGMRGANGSLLYAGTYTSYWSSSAININYAWNLLVNGGPFLCKTLIDTLGNSVRCVMN